ncbi:class I SAM-dependent DNA methyltransferase [Streptomyces sp. NPDC059863]|uniref:HsdM family class I SAM-dependent methyltransferase n=1 Tax=unclassified Streptomyces TaxID=2593676 RepID=UPI0036628812
MEDEGSVSAPVVTAAQLARLAGVTRAAVANWRRRHEDFPAPVGGTAAGPLFSLAETEAWLAGQRKGRGVSKEVALWQALRAAYGDDMTTALVDVGSHLTHEAADALRDGLRDTVDQLAAERTAPQLFEDLVNRFIASAGRSGAQAVSSPRLVRAFTHFAGTVKGLVYDPACGAGSLLLAVVGADAASRAGQEINTGLVRLARLRAGLAGGAPARLEAGDSLRDDRHPGLRAQLVVCEPPVGQSDWGREDLLLDSRWELGAPPRAESDLAWLQHCYFHTAPGGRTLIALAPSAAYRKSGRRIRTELVRRGALVSVVALPPGLATSHNLPLLLWELRRPAAAGEEVRSVRMADLRQNDPDGPLSPTTDQVADVPLIDLLREDVDLSPSAYVTAAQPDYPAEYTALRTELERRLRELAELLPSLPPGPGAGALNEFASVGVTDLVQAGLVRTEGSAAVSTSDQLDTDYLRGFLRSAGNIRRSTSSSGTHRADVRGAHLPQMEIEQQRQYGAAFRYLGEFEQRLKELARMGDQAARLAYDGLTNGALAPMVTPDPATPDPATQEGAE